MKHSKIYADSRVINKVLWETCHRLLVFVIVSFLRVTSLECCVEKDSEAALELSRNEDCFVTMFALSRAWGKEDVCVNTRHFS